MVLKVYGFPISIATKRVTLILRELNVPYEFIFVDFPAGAHKSPEYIEYQPFGEVPYIVRRSSSLRSMDCCFFFYHFIR